LDEVKKQASLEQQNGFSPAFFQFAEVVLLAERAINMI
jgi:hypothetical protein